MTETSPDQPDAAPEHTTPAQIADPGMADPGMADPGRGDQSVAAEILRQAGACPPGKSISPEDVARALSQSPDFQRLLTAVRRAAQRLAREGRIDILRKGKPIDPDELRGVIRLRARRDPAAPGTP